MFLDSHNDGIEFYIEKIDDDTIALTDDGWYLQILQCCGLDLENPRVAEQINSYKNTFNFDVVGEEIVSNIKNKIDGGSAEYSISVLYAGNFSRKDILFDFGNISSGTYYLHLGGFKKQDSSNSVLIKIESINF